jgi:hypothetical protein
MRPHTDRKRDTFATARYFNRGGEYPTVEVLLDDWAYDRGYRIGQGPLDLYGISQVLKNCQIAAPEGIRFGDDHNQRRDKAFVVRYKKAYGTGDGFSQEVMSNLVIALRSKTNALIGGLEEERYRLHDDLNNPHRLALAPESGFFPHGENEGSFGLTKAKIRDVVNFVARPHMVEYSRNRLDISYPNANATEPFRAMDYEKFAGIKLYILHKLDVVLIND